jgi:hypothetical protein
MKNKKIKPTRSRFNVLRQICNLIPEHEVSKIARETGALDKSRTFSPWSHTVSLLDAQLTHCIGLNDLCDSLQLHSGPLSTLRGATAPSRNGLSHANRERPARMAEQLFWRVLEHLKEQTPGFAAGKRRGPAFRFKMPIHVMDSTTMELVANCLDWAKHRRRKAAAKTHLRLNLQSLLPSFVIVDTAAEHDNKRARELCADLKSGEIALFDKGYVDFGHLGDLDERGVFWVTRAKENMVYEVVRKMPASKDAKILRDEVIVLRNENKPAPELMRQGGGAGQDRWRGTGNDLPDQQPGVESAQRGRPLPLPLANRSVLQANQADFAVGRFSGPQRQCRALAGVDGAVDLRASALPELPLQLGA